MGTTRKALHAGRPAFEWNVYSDRKSALVHLRKTHALADTILETEDGSANELVHSQVMSAFGVKLSEYIKLNGEPSNRGPQLRRVRLPKLNRYTLHILVECAYTGSICTDLTSGGIWQILELADYYEMQDVIRACCHFLAKNLDQHNCLHFYHVGLKHQHPLMRSAWHTIRANFKHILAENLLRLKLDPQTMEPLPTDINNGGFGAAAIARLPSSRSDAAGGAQVSRALVGGASAAAGAADETPSGGGGGGGDKYNNWLATMMFEHYQELLMHDKLNVEREESVWFAIKLWCQFPSLVGEPRANSSELATKTAPPLDSASVAANTDPRPAIGSGFGLDGNEQRQRTSRVAELLPCMRFPRFRTGTEFSTQRIWRDPLIFSSKQAQHQLAVLDRNHRDFLSSSGHAAASFSPATTFQGSARALSSPPSSSSSSSPSSSSLSTASLHQQLGSPTASASGNHYHSSRDGFGLPCAVHPRQLRPRVPHSVLLAIGGWQQGQPTKLIESYDLNCNLWFESKHEILLSLAYHGIENIAGLLYICGGTNGSEIVNEVFTFDPLTGDCRQAPSMREARCYVSTAYLDGYLYAMGGHNGWQRVKSAERFQVMAAPSTFPASAASSAATSSASGGGARSSASGSAGGGQSNVGDGTGGISGGGGIGGIGGSGQWTHVQDMQVARSDGSACVHAGRIYIAGGLNDQVIESSVEFYNQQDNTWTFIGSMITPRTSFTLLAYGGSLLAIGGNDGSERLSSVERFDFSTKSWSLHSNMRHRRSTFSACLVDQDKLIVVGGYNGQTPFSQVEMFDGRAHEWVALRRMHFDRSGLKVVAVNDLANAPEYTYLGNADKLR